MLIGPNNKKAITIKANKAILKAHAFLLPPIIHNVKYEPSQGSTYYLITKIMVSKALFCQSFKKTPSLNIHNFQIF